MVEFLRASESIYKKQLKEKLLEDALKMFAFSGPIQWVGTRCVRKILKNLKNVQRCSENFVLFVLLWLAGCFTCLFSIWTQKLKPTDDVYSEIYKLKHNFTVPSKLITVDRVLAAEESGPTIRTLLGGRRCPRRLVGQAGRGT